MTRPTSNSSTYTFANMTDISGFDRAPAGGVVDLEFDTINLAQIPSYLLISVPKLNDVSLAGDMSVFNLSRNLSIRSIRIIVNSARGAIEKSADVDTGFIDAERLWEMTKENCNSKYFVDGGFRAWRDHNCALLLSSSQFASGLMACDGVAYPVQLQVQIRVENRSVDLCAQAELSQPGASRQAASAGSRRTSARRGRLPPSTTRSSSPRPRPPEPSTA